MKGKTAFQIFKSYEKGNEVYFRKSYNFPIQHFPLGSEAPS